MRLQTNVLLWDQLQHTKKLKIVPIGSVACCLHLNSQHVYALLAPVFKNDSRGNPHKHKRPLLMFRRQGNSFMSARKYQLFQFNSQLAFGLKLKSNFRQRHAWGLSSPCNNNEPLGNVRSGLLIYQTTVKSSPGIIRHLQVNTGAFHGSKWSIKGRHGARNWI